MKIRPHVAKAIAATCLTFAASVILNPAATVLAQPVTDDVRQGVETVPVREQSIVEEVYTPPATTARNAPVQIATPAPVVTGSSYNAGAVDEILKLSAASEVLRELTRIPEGISPDLLANAYGIVVIPGTIKLGFFFGGQYGSGIAMTRNDDGSWSNPSFVYLAGGSFGLQFGAVSSDIILVFKTRKSIMGLTKGNFTLGADAAVAAGPVGRRAVAATDWQLKAEIYSYARSRGLFAGVSLDGSVLAIDRSANAKFYSSPGISAEEVFALPPSTAPGVVVLKQFLAENAAKPRLDY
jgi:lipid-binding SYLF domain-containing protein